MRHLLTTATFCAVTTLVFAQAPVFEVASIKPNLKGTVVLPDGRVATGTNIAVYSGRFTAQNVGVRTLVHQSYGVLEFQVEGGPTWIVGERFDVDAKAPMAVDDATVMLMLRSLLAERFGLVVRRVTRQLPAHVLVTTSKGLRLTLAAPAMPKKGFRFVLLGVNDDTTQRMRLTGTGSLADLASTVSRAMRMPVVDESGATGVFDVTVDWTSESFGNGMKATERSALAGAPLTFPAVDPELNAAFQRQLGLKFETRKAAVEMLVIDAVERPTEN